PVALRGRGGDIRPLVVPALPRRATRLKPLPTLTLHRPHRTRLEMQSYPLRWFAPLVLASSLFAAAPAKPVVAVDRSFMNPAVSPCVDFYTYANGAFDAVAIPGEYSAYGVNQEI